MDSNFTSIHRFAEQSISLLNEQIKKIDWDKKWASDYPKTDRAKKETEVLNKPEIKEALKEVFSEQSLVVARLRESL